MTRNVLADSLHYFTIHGCQTPKLTSLQMQLGRPIKHSCLRYPNPPGSYTQGKKKGKKLVGLRFRWSKDLLMQLKKVVYTNKLVLVHVVLLSLKETKESKFPTWLPTMSLLAAYRGTRNIYNIIDVLVDLQEVRTLGTSKSVKNTWLDKSPTSHQPTISKYLHTDMATQLIISKKAFSTFFIGRRVYTNHILGWLFFELPVRWVTYLPYARGDLG